MSVLGWWVPRSDGNLECQPSKQSPLDPRDKKPGSLGQGSKTYKRGAREKYDPFQRRRRREILWGGPSKPNLMQLFRLPSHTLFLPAAACCCCGTREAPMRRQVAASALFLRGKVQRSGETWIGGLGRQTQKNICFSLSCKWFVQKISLDAIYLSMRKLILILVSWVNGVSFSGRLVLKS